MNQKPLMTREEVEAFLDREFPQVHIGGRIFSVEDVGLLTGRMRMAFDERHVRPGGTLSGPSMMTLADLALYATILANIGPVALAVTTSLTFNFLRKPAQKALIGEARLLKLGRRLAVGEVAITVEGETDLICHATGTYSIPQRR